MSGSLLSNDVLFFFIGGDIVNLFRYDARFFVDAAVRSFNETEFIDLAETSQGRNQADVRTFRRFYRAHTAIVRMVDVADFKACTFTGQTAGAKGTQTAFMCIISAKGLVWSMNWDSWLEPKNSLIAATGRILIRTWGVMLSAS